MVTLTPLHSRLGDGLLLLLLIIFAETACIHSTLSARVFRSALVVDMGALTLGQAGPDNIIKMCIAVVQWRRQQTSWWWWSEQSRAATQWTQINRRVNSFTYQYTEYTNMWKSIKAYYDTDRPQIDDHRLVEFWYCALLWWSRGSDIQLITLFLASPDPIINVSRVELRDDGCLYGVCVLLLWWLHQVWVSVQCQSVAVTSDWTSPVRGVHSIDMMRKCHCMLRTDYIHSLESPTCRVWQQAVNSKVQSQFYSRSQWLFVWSVQWLRWGRERSIFWCFAGLNWSHTSIINTSQACMRAMHSVRQSEQQTATTPPCTRERGGGLHSVCKWEFGPDMAWHVFVPRSTYVFCFVYRTDCWRTTTSCLIWITHEWVPRGQRGSFCDWSWC